VPVRAGHDLDRAAAGVVAAGAGRAAPGQVEGAERLRDGIAEALGDQLVGLYLHGSLALGDFYPPASDVDFHAATTGALDAPALERLGAMHARFKVEGGWLNRLEGVYLPPAALRRRDPAGGGCPGSGSTGNSAWGSPGRPGCWTAG
jgi:hypothetical protein